MIEGTIGRRYARALAEIVEEEGKDLLARVEDELGAISSLMSDKGDFHQAMLNPSFSPADRSAILTEVAKSSGMHDLTGRLLQLLVEKDRVRWLPSVASAFKTEVDERTGRVRAHITSARPLADSDLNTLTSALAARTGKTVLPEVDVDESVISGVRAQIGGLVFDSTLRSRLDRLRQQLAN